MPGIGVINNPYSRKNKRNPDWMRSLGYLAGTMNIAANSCGIRGTSAGLMVNLVHKYRQSVPFETTWRDTLKIETGPRLQIIIR